MGFKKWKMWLLAGLAAVFVLATSALTFVNRSQGSLRVARFDWPDEMATAFFAERITDGLPIAARDPLIAAAANRMHPRSVNVRDSALVPGGFIGFPILLGTLGIWFGYGKTFLVTPLLAVVGVLSLMSIVRRVFDARTAWLTGVLAFTNPALLYYTSYVMLPNVAFASLALAGAAFIIARRWTFLGGLLTGLALFIRPNEAVWVVPVFVFLTMIPPLHLSPASQGGEMKKNFLPLAKQGGGLRWGIPILGLLIGFSPTLLANWAVFGHPFATGYSRFADAMSDVASPLEFSGSWLLPFGINVRLILSNLWNSTLKLFWWIVIPAIAGVVLVLRSKRAARDPQLAYLLVAALVGIWLVIYYGSWPFTDVEILNLNTIGRSYVRYWLPAFLLFLPFVAVSIRRLGRYGSLMAVLCMTFLSVRLVYWSAPESLWPVADRIFNYHLALYDIRNDVPRDGIIITWRTDKVVFPERRVAETDLSYGPDPELVAVVKRTSSHEWFVLAALTDEQVRRIDQSFGDRKLAVVGGRWGMGIRLFRIVHL